jgi:hypothetical protein
VMHDRPTSHEIAAAPRTKSRRSADTGNCVEITRVRGWAAISDSKNPDLVYIDVPARSWSAFRNFAKELAE